MQISQTKKNEPDPHTFLIKLTPKKTFELLTQNDKAVLIDVRSTMEYLFIGHPKDSLHIPWIDEPDWNINPNFIDSVTKTVKNSCDKSESELEQPIILICRSGKRSIESGTYLVQAGFNNISYVDDGFEGDLDENHIRGNIGGWRYHNLPWEQC